MTTGQLIKELQKFHPTSPVMILIPIRKQKFQVEFVEELKTVTEYERNDATDCPQLCTQYWHREVSI